ILRRAEEVHGESEHTLVVRPDQLLKSVLVACLGRPDQRIDLWTQTGAHRSSRIRHNSRYVYAFPTPAPALWDRRSCSDYVTYYCAEMGRRREETLRIGVVWRWPIGNKALLGRFRFPSISPPGCSPSTHCPTWNPSSSPQPVERSPIPRLP